MTFLTDFADQAVTLPAAIAVLLGLVLAGWVRGAVAWTVCVAGVLTAVLGLKLVGVACGEVLGWDKMALVSASGHTASACMVYGGLAALLAPRSRLGEGVVALAACAVGLAVGVTRIGLHVHSPVEVAVGAGVGLMGVIALRLSRGSPPLRAARPWIMVIPLAAVLMLHGRRLNAEPDVRWVAQKVWPLSMCMKVDIRMPKPRGATAPHP